MGSASEDKMRVVTTKLVERRTFLHLEPQRDAGDDCRPLRLRLKRCASDTCVDYACGTDLDAYSTEVGSSRTPSIASAEPLEHMSMLDLEEHSFVSQTTDLNDDERDAALQAVWPKTAQPSQFIATQHEQLYYYFPIPSAPMMCNTFTPPQIACQLPPASVALDAIYLDAQAALAKADARLKAAKANYEAAAHSSKFSPQFEASMPATTQAHTGAIASQSAQSELTTLMLRNIPNDYTRSMLLDLLDSMGLFDKYDFVYLPIDFGKMAGLGYAFVNFVWHADAEMARHTLQGFNQWKIQSQKVCAVVWGQPLQGFEAHVERYRSSPVMHKDVPDEYKPIILQGGVRVPFPQPTKRVRHPHA